MNIRAWLQSTLKGILWGGTVAGSVDYRGGILRTEAPAASQYDANSIVQACLVKILDAFADAPLVSGTITDDGQESYDYGSSFAQLMRRPSPAKKIGGRRLRRALVASAELDGNAYADLIKDGAGRIREMEYIPHWACKPLEAPDGTLSGYEITVRGGKTERRQPDEVFHYAVGIDPTYPLKGISPLRSLLLQVMTDNEADAYTAEIIRNPAIIGIAVWPEDGDPGPDNARFLESQINSKFTQGGRGGLFVSSFRGRMEKIGFTPADLALDKMREVPEERISAVMNVPAIVAGLGAGLARSTFANTDQARKYFARYKIAPLWDAFEEELSIQVLPMTEGYQSQLVALFDRRRIPDLQPDLNELHGRVRDDFVSNLITRGEGREALNMPAGAADNVYFADVMAGLGGTAKALRAELAEKARQRRLAFEQLALEDASYDGITDTDI